MQGSSIPDRVESHGYSPFKVDFKQNKVEWALARVDDLVNWGRKARRKIMTNKDERLNKQSRFRDHCGL